MEEIDFDKQIHSISAIVCLSGFQYQGYLAECLGVSKFSGVRVYVWNLQVEQQHYAPSIGEALCQRMYMYSVCSFDTLQDLVFVCMDSQRDKEARGQTLPLWGKMTLNHSHSTSSLCHDL